MSRIDTKRGREALPIRREPYWYKLARDRHLGLRKLTEGTRGSWIARFRDESGADVIRRLANAPMSSTSTLPKSPPRPGSETSSRASTATVTTGNPSP